MSIPAGWQRESADLFVHESGASLSRTTYRGKSAWWFFPVSLDIPAVEYPATDAGRDEAFATSGTGLPKAKAKAKARSKPTDGKPEPQVAGKTKSPPDDSEEDGEEDDSEPE
jgi:hypothetical protein